jgi:hypothetical protein
VTSGVAAEVKEERMVRPPMQRTSSTTMRRKSQTEAKRDPNPCWIEEDEPWSAESKNPFIKPFTAAMSG